MRRFCLILATACFTLQGVQATSWMLPQPQLFSAQGGNVTYGFKLLPDNGPMRKPATGELFQLKPTGATPVLWRGKLLNQPLRAYVAPTGQVITVDTHAGGSTKHALVIYSPRGKVVLDLSFSEVAPGQEKNMNFFIGVSGPFLSKGFTPKFVYWDKVYFGLSDGKGGGPVFDLETGKRKR